jgi:hypothetical protein
VKISISPINVMCVLWALNVLARPTTSYLPMRGPRFRSTPSVNAPATPCTTADAIESWKPKRVVIQPPELQPQAASRIHTTEPSITARIKKAERRTRSMSAPDMIDAVVQENSRKARKKTRLTWSWRFGPMPSLQGAVRPQKPGNASGELWPSLGHPSSMQP